MSYLDERIKIDGIELYQVAIPLLVPLKSPVEEATTGRASLSK